MTNSLEELGDVIARTLRPFPGETVVVQHPGHDIVHARTVFDPHAFGLVIVRHVQPAVHKSCHHFMWSINNKSDNSQTFASLISLQAA